MKVYFLIVCEGEKTEPNYFKRFPRAINDYVYELEFGGGGISTIKVVEKAIEIRDKSPVKFDSVWAVFDKDDFKAKDFNAAIKKGSENEVKCAWSNEAFELWYLLHFQYRDTPMSRHDYKRTISDEVNKKTRKKGKKAYIYAKNSSENYDIMEKHGDINQAIKNAEKLIKTHTNEKYHEHNPCTTVHLLVKELTGKDNTFNKKLEEKFAQGE